MLETHVLIQNRLGLNSLKSFADQIYSLLTVEWVEQENYKKENPHLSEEGEMMGLSKKEKLRFICEKHNIILLYLFGSQEKRGLEILNNSEFEEKRDPIGDIDVGIVFPFDLNKITKRYILYSEVFNDLEEIFRPEKLDLVFLQECHSILQFEAIKGNCIYFKSEEFREQFEMNVLRRLPDIKYLLANYEKEFLEPYQS